MAIPDQADQPQGSSQRIIDAAQTGATAYVAGQAAQGGVIAPATAVGAPPAKTASAIVGLTWTAAKWAIILKVLRRLFARHRAESADWLEAQLAKLFPDVDPTLLRQIVERELDLEKRFQQKALKRVQAAHAAAGALPTPAQQAAALKAAMNKEKQYAALRQKAMLARAKAAVETAKVKEQSPGGAKWMLGDRKNHTPGCVALSGKPWPWSVLEQIPPPVHAGCGCWLAPLGPNDVVPEHGEAMHMAKAALALEKGIREAADPGEIDSYLAGQEVRPGIARALHQLETGEIRLNEASWKEFLHPRGRGGKWIDKLGPKGEEHKEPKVFEVPKIDPHMPELSPGSTVVKGPPPEAEAIIGGDAPEPLRQGAIPSFQHIRLTMQPHAWGADHRAKAGDQEYIVREHSGDRSHVASELLSNAVYRELGVAVPTMGHVQTAPEPDFSQRKDDLPDEPPIDAPPGTRVSTGIILRDKDGRVTLIEPRNHYGGYIHTFPKGGVEPTLTPQQNAHKELWEETGLHAHITGVVGDFKGDTGTSRYYLGVRTGGEATPSKETEGIKTVTPDEAAQMLNRQRDQDVLKALLEQPVSEGEYADDLPPEQPGSALAYTGLAGTKTKSITEPNEPLGRAYMADALLANRDFLGQHGQNIRWQDDDTPIRVNMGNTLGYGHSGRHEFADTPEEVWTMRTRGQAAGIVTQNEDHLREQARTIANTLTPAKIDQLTRAAPFPTEQERKQVASTLKNRVAWMRRFANGEESIPTPLHGAEARTQFADAQNDFEVYPEEQEAIEQHAASAGRDLDAHLQAGKGFTDTERKTVKRLDQVLEATDAPADSYMYMGVDAAPGDDMVGKTFSMKQYIRAHTNMADAQGKARIRLLVPAGGRALYRDDAAEGEPDMLLPRDQRIHVTGRSVGPDGKPMLEGLVLPYQNPRALPTPYKLPPPQSFGFVPPKQAGVKVKYEKGDRVLINGVKATVTGSPGGGKVNIVTDEKKGYTVPYTSLDALQEAPYTEALHPRGRGGEWIRKLGEPIHEPSRAPEWPEEQPWQRSGTKKSLKQAADFASDAFSGSVSDQEIDRLREYQDESYQVTNQQLRQHKVDKNALADQYKRGDTTVGQIINGLDSAIGKCTTRQDMTLFRGFDKGVVERLQAGDEFRDDGFVSTTLRKSVTDDFLTGGTETGSVVEIRVPAGAHALSFDQSGAAQKSYPESEVLLPRGSAFRVLGTEPLVLGLLPPSLQEAESKAEDEQPPAADRARRYVWQASDVRWLGRMQEAEWSEALHPRGRGGEWTKKLGFRMESAWRGEGHEDLPQEPTPGTWGDHRLVAVHSERGDIGNIYFGHYPEPGDKGIARLRIHFMQVGKQEQHHGVADAMMSELERRYPNAVIDHGTHTEQGAKWAQHYYGDANVRFTRGGKPLHEPLGEAADFKEWLHPRGRGGKWIKSAHALRREASLPSEPEVEQTPTAAAPREQSIKRIEALGIKVTPPGPKSKLSDQEVSDIADVFEEAFKQYPILDHGPGPPVRQLSFASSGSAGKLGHGTLADTAIHGGVSVIRVNDAVDFHRHPAGPPPPGTHIGGSLSPSSRSWAGVMWHELGHAMMNGIDMAGHHDSKRYVDWMSRYGVTFDDSKNLSTYAVASRSEGIAEMSSMANTPGYLGLLPPDMQAKVSKMFDDLHNWDPNTPYSYQEPAGGLPEAKPKAPKPKPPAPTYKLPSPGKLSDIEAQIKADPGTAGPKQPVSDLNLTPGDVIEGSTPGLRYLVISDPSEHTGLRYVPLNQGKSDAYRFSATSKRRKVNLHFDLDEPQ